MRITIRDLEFYAYHGVPPEEQAVGHRYVANVEYEVDGRAGETDMVEDTVDYAAVALRIQQVVQSERVKTLERLVTVCGQTLMREYPKIQHLDLYIGKRLPPAPVVVDEIGVERAFSRS